MARTIDERIVQMTFNNEEFERRAGTTISTLEKLKGALDFNKMSTSFTGLQKSVNKVDFSGLTNGLTSINNGFNAMEQIATGALRRIGDTITGHVLSALNNVKNAITSLTTQQINVGYNKYNDLTSSVQTLVNSTGKSVDEIDKYLKRLMWYSDETSFGFTDMTKALGTMVSAGGDIDELIPMLMGIGNAVAYAGKGASEFSRVIYNLNQSYSTGALKTMDWRSIELAGADSKVLKEQLMAAAVNLKTINKEQAKLSNFSDLVSKGKITREVMQQAFGAFAQMTLEAEKLVNTGVYDTASEAIESLSGRFEEFAERAFKSAQEAKSFKEAIEATQDAVSSGWMQTFQLIFGDYNESKALWTDVTNTFWEIFASGAARRNSILEAWADIWDQRINAPKINSVADYEEWQKVTPYLTQTQALLDSISQFVLAIRDDISATFRSVFPIHTLVTADGKAIEDYSHIAKVIYDTVESIRKAFIDLTENGLNGDIAVALRSSFRALLQVMQTVIAYAKVFNDSFIKPLAERLKPVVLEIANILKRVSDIIGNTAIKARSDMTPFEKLLSNILNILDPIINAIQKALHWVNEFVNGVQRIDVFDGIFRSIGNVVKFISDAVSGTIPVLQKLGDLLGTVFEKIKTGFQNFLQQSGTDVSRVAEGGFLGYLTYGLVVVIKKFKEFIEAFKISDVSKGLMDGFAQGIKDTFSALKEGIDSLLGKGGGNAGFSGLKQVADAIMELAAALLVLSLVDGDKIVGSLAGIAVVLTEVIGAIAILNGMSFGKTFTSQGKGIQKFFSSISAGFKNLTGQGNKDFNTAIKAVKTLAFAILELSVALKIMSTIDPLGMTTALVGLGVALGELAVFMVILSGVSKDLQAGDTKALAKMLSKLGFAMIEISAAMKIMSTLDGNGLSTALIGMGAALAEIGAFVIAVSKWTGGGAAAKIATLGPTMIGIGLALIEVAAAMKLLSTIDSTGIDTSLVALFGALGSIALFTIAVSKFTKGGAVSFVAISAGLLVMAVAIGGFTVALTALSALGIEKVIEGLKSFLLLMGSLALTSAVLGVLSPLLLAASVALIAFGGALHVISSGMLKAVEAFALFKVIGSDFALTVIDLLTDTFTAIIGLIPAIIAGIIQAVIGSANELIKLVGEVIQILITAINDDLPVILNGIITFVSNVLEALGSAIELWLPKIFIILETILSDTITWLTDYIPTLLSQIAEFLVSVINGLAETVRSLGGGLGSAIGNLASAIIEAIIDGLFSAVGSFASNLLDFGKTLVDNVTSFLQGDNAAKKSIDSGKKVINDYEAGAKERTPAMLKQINKIGTDTTNTLDREKDSISMGEKLIIDFKTGNENKHDELIESIDTTGEEVTDKMDRTDDAEEAAENTAMGFINRIYSKLGEFSATGAAAGSAFMDGLASSGALDYASPSKATAKAATYAVQGFINTIDRETGTIFDSGEDFGSSFLSALRDSISMSEEILSSEMNPVITPVLDLSNIENNAGLISALLGSGSTYNSALAINDLQNGLANQNGRLNQVVVDVNFTVNNAGADINSFDLERFGDQIADAVNIKLGQLLS